MLQADPHAETHLPLIVRWRNVIQAADVPALTKLVCYTLGQYAGPDGENIFPSIARIAKDTGMTERSVRTHLQYAERHNLVQRERRGRGVYRYWPAFGEGIEVPPGPERGAARERNEVPLNKTTQRIRPTIQPAEPTSPPEPSATPPAAESPDGDERKIEEDGPTETTSAEVTPEQVVALFNTLLAEVLQPQRKVGPVRDAIEAILDARPEAEKLSWWHRRFLQIRRTPWMTGGMSSGWKASLYWLIKPDSQGRLGIDKLGELDPGRAPGAAGKDFTGVSRRPELLGLPH